MDVVSSLVPEAMSSRIMQQRRSSVFEIPVYCKPRPCGSSVTSFAYDPRGEEETYVPKRPLVQYENTYQTEPPKRFEAENVTAIMRKVLEDNLRDKEYDATTCAMLSKGLSTEIKTSVKALGFDRYKIVCSVTIGEVNDQDVRVASRCVWDVDRDTYAAASYRNSCIFATGLVFASYYE